MADRGSLSVYVAVLAVPFLLIAGLVVDGSGGLVARQRAADLAEQAARAGANQIDLAALRDKGVRQIDDQAAKAAVDRYFNQVRGTDSGVTYDPAIVAHGGGERVTVTVHVAYAPIVLTGMIPTTYSATATAIPLTK